MISQNETIVFTIPLSKRQQCLDYFRQGYGFKKTAYLTGLNIYTVREYQRKYKSGDIHWADGCGVVVDRAEPANKNQGTANTLKTISSSIASIDYSEGLKLGDYMTFKSFVASVDNIISDRVAAEFTERIIRKQFGLDHVADEITKRIAEHNHYGKKFDIDYPYIRDDSESFHMVVETRCITPSACSSAFDRSQIRLITRDIKALSDPSIRKAKVYEGDDYSNHYKFLALMDSGDSREAVAAVMEKWNTEKDGLKCEFLSSDSSVSDLEFEKIYVVLIEVPKDMILAG